MIERPSAYTRTPRNSEIMNDTPLPQDPPEANKAAGAGCMTRIVRPLSKDGVADCPQCHSTQSVARHNADWTCYKCGYCEIVDDDREAECYGHLYGPHA